MCNFCLHWHKVQTVEQKLPLLTEALFLNRDGVRVRSCICVILPHTTHLMRRGSVVRGSWASRIPL